MGAYGCTAIGALAGNTFTHTQAIELLVSLAVSEQMRSPLMGQLRAIRSKLMASLSPETKRRIRGLKKRILIGETASHYVLSTFAPPRPKVAEGLHQWFVQQHCVDVSYCGQGEL